MIKRIWAPLDLRGLRLYLVHQTFSNHPDWTNDYIVAGKGPNDAAQNVQESQRGMTWNGEPIYRGVPLKVLQPESWVHGSAPDPALDQCRHENRGLIQSSRFAGDSGTGSENVSICLNCGIIQIFGDRNGEHFEISIHIVNSEYLDAIKRWVDYVNGETQNG